MVVKDRGADMQPEFDKLFSLQRGPHYEPAKSAGWVQDALRREDPGTVARGSRQTLGDPEDYSNAASAGTANTPVKPTQAKKADD